MKKVSILMMTYNNVDNFKRTFQSIIMQDYPNIEIVISDNESSDGTVQMIEQFAVNNTFDIKWVSEKDGGLYNALNKDLKMATGDYILVFNDEFIDKSAISKLVNAIENENCDGAHADLIYADEENVKRYWHMKNGSLKNGWMPGHPTLMLKKAVYEKYGFYNEKFKIAADYEFMIRILKDGSLRLAYVPDILVRMYYGGTSTNGVGSYVDSLKEGHQALVQNGVKGALLADILRLARVIVQFLRKGQATSIWKTYQSKRLESSI